MLQEQDMNKKIAIIGMDCLVNNCPGLDQFERSIYEGRQHFAPLEIETAESLLEKVIKTSLEDADLRPGTKIGLIVVSETEISAKCSDYTEKVIALTVVEKSSISALNLAENILMSQQVDAVLIASLSLAENSNNTAKISQKVQTLSYDLHGETNDLGVGVAAVVLQSEKTAKQENKRIYAIIEAVSVVQAGLADPKAVSQVSQTAMELADVKVKNISYVEVVASGVPTEDEAEIQGLISAYTGSGNLSCALGSIKANIGNTQSASGIFSLIKTSLCLAHSYIPAVPQWTGPKTPDVWCESPFYVMTESKPWFLSGGFSERRAAINLMESDGKYAHLILSEVPNQPRRNNRYLAQMPFCLLAIAGEERNSLLTQLEQLQETLASPVEIGKIAHQYWEKLLSLPSPTYTVAILGSDRQELTKEIQLALTGINVAFDTGKDWQTPQGSYFTAKPLGKHSEIAFVYPGSFMSYVGLGRNLFRLFPQIYDDPLIGSVYERVTKIEQILYPRSLTKLSKRQMEEMEKGLMTDLITMQESELGFASLLTVILQNYFQIKSRHSFGYSLGETTMLLARGVWKSFKETSDYLNSSPLFKTRLSGPKYAVREYWGIPPTEELKQDFWSNYFLICPLELVEQAIATEDRVYISLINTPQEVVISGETQACQRVIAKLGVNSFASPSTNVIHCEPTRPEYEEIVKIYSIPVHHDATSDKIFYSTASYAPITLDSETIGQNIAKAICDRLDFPRLVNRVYDDNVKIFIEVGVGSNCSRWISETLKSKPHVSVFLNRRGMDEYTSILRALAKLLSHQVELDLSPLYSLSMNNYPSLTTILENDHSLLTSRSYHYEKVSNNNAYMTKNQGLFLKMRQNSLEKMKQMIENQIDTYQQI
jgi:PfaB family protein